MYINNIYDLTSDYNKINLNLMDCFNEHLPKDESDKLLEEFYENIELVRINCTIENNNDNNNDNNEDNDDNNEDNEDNDNNNYNNYKNYNENNDNYNYKNYNENNDNYNEISFTGKTNFKKLNKNIIDNNNLSINEQFKKRNSRNVGYNNKNENSTYSTNRSSRIDNKLSKKKYNFKFKHTRTL